MAGLRSGEEREGQAKKEERKEEGRGTTTN